MSEAEDGKTSTIVYQHESKQSEDHRDAKNSGDKLIGVWFSSELTLDAVDFKSQKFIITGWINCIWEWDKSIDKKALETLIANKVDIEPKFKKPELYKVVRDYLPIPPWAPFDPASTKKLVHVSPPSFAYDESNNLAHTQYHIYAEILERFELYQFPFDYQFLNMKIKLKKSRYYILPFDKPSNACQKMFEVRTWYKDPLTISLRYPHVHYFLVSDGFLNVYIFVSEIKIQREITR